MCALLQPLWICAQTMLPLTSPSETLKADILVNEKSVRIALSDKGEKVMEAKTLQLELKENMLAGNWQVTGQARTSVDQTWQPVYGERSLVTTGITNWNFIALRSEPKEMTCSFACMMKGWLSVMPSISLISGIVR